MNCWVNGQHDVFVHNYVLRCWRNRQVMTTSSLKPTSRQFNILIGPITIGYLENKETFLFRFPAYFKRIFRIVGPEVVS